MEEISKLKSDIARLEWFIFCLVMNKDIEKGSDDINRGYKTAELDDIVFRQLKEDLRKRMPNEKEYQ